MESTGKTSTFPPPWRVEQAGVDCYEVRDANGFKLATVHCRDDLQKWSFGHGHLTSDEARRIAKAIARLSSLSSPSSLRPLSSAAWPSFFIPCEYCFRSLTVKRGSSGPSGVGLATTVRRMLFSILVATIFSVVISLHDYRVTGTWPHYFTDAPSLLSYLGFPLVLGAACVMCTERYSRGLFALFAAAVLLPAQSLLALTLGSELITSLGLVGAECEPVPSGFTGTVMTIKSREQEERDRFLVHSVHRMAEVRQTVASLLRTIQPIGPTL
jgi:hypothetical protein